MAGDTQPPGRGRRRDDLPPDGISVFFPVYNDEHTIERVARKALAVCRELTDQFEVIIVDDGSPDRSGELAEKLAEEHPEIRAVHHRTNLGYGAAVRTGLEACSNPWICFTDGDDEYDLYDLIKLWRLREFYDLIITFRYVRRYSGFRTLTSRVYNLVLRRLFYIHYRDVSTGLRLVRKEVIDNLDLEATSPFIGAEIAIKTMLRGYRVGEMGIQTFPREFGSGGSTSATNIRRTIVDMVQCHRKVFSADYELPVRGARSASARRREALARGGANEEPAR